MQLEFFYDVVCPYAYLASTRVEALAERHGVDLVWRPLLLGGVFKSIYAGEGAGDGPMGSFAPAKAVLNLKDLSRQAERWGVPLTHPVGHPRRSVEAMRLLTACAPAARPALSHALYRAYWVDGADISDRDVLRPLAEAHGVALERIDAPETKQALRASTDEAVERGVFGVPALFLGERMWWGNDRLHLLDGALSGTRTWPGELMGPLPSRREWPEAPRVRLFHDFSSPFSYLGVSNAARVVSEHGGRLELVPMLLGALFNDIGTALVPMATFPPNKTRYFARDLAEWAEWWGVPFRFTSHFPLHTVAALRSALQDPAVTPAIYRAAWADDRDVGDASVLQAVLDEAGFDGAALLAGTQRPEIKARLRANTEEAQRLGVCGAPTFVVDLPGETGPLLLWGQDRLPMLADVLDGWVPSAV